MVNLFASMALALLGFGLMPRLVKHWKLHFVVSFIAYWLYLQFLYKPTLIGVEGLVFLSALLFWLVGKKSALEASLLSVGVYLSLVTVNLVTGFYYVLYHSTIGVTDIPYFLREPRHWTVFFISAIGIILSYRFLANSMRRKIGSFKISHLVLLSFDGVIILIALSAGNFLFRFFVRSSEGIRLIPGLSGLLFIGMVAAIAMIVFLIYFLNSYWITHFNFKAFQSAADLDSLTGVLNRSSGLRRIQEVHRHARAVSGDFVICFVDVNNLKTVNDRYGHKEGDAMIQHVAGALSKTLRDGDFVCRLGGDEFVLCFNHCNLEAGERAWRRIGQEVDSLAFKHDKPYRISVSHGMVAFSDHRRLSAKSLIEKADELMYVQKRRLKELQAAKGTHII